MVGLEANVFVEVKSSNPTEIQPLIAVHTDQFSVKRQWCAARGEAENGIRLAANEIGNDARSGAGGGFRCGLDDYFHGRF